MAFALQATSRFVGIGGSASILLVLCSERREFFEPQVSSDLDDGGRDKLRLLGPVALYHWFKGVHTMACAMCVSGRDAVFVEKLSRFVVTET